ncbi:pseudouridine synthase [Mycena filopes]|nr:pseudouridine synthase [Mycena filopes]
MSYRQKLAQNVFRWSDRILYVDRSLVLLNKPPGFTTQLDPSTTAVEGGNLSKFLHDVKQCLEFPDPPFHVHRLDKATTGCFLLARSSSSAKTLSQLFRRREINKIYLALVRGTSQDFAQKSGEVRVHLEFPFGRPRVAQEEGPGTQLSVTQWELVASSPHLPLSLLRLKLLTGRKHQLRVHLNEVLKTPILGDKQHSDAMVPLDFAVPVNRLFLHASQISFFTYRPTGQGKRFMIRFLAPLPQDFVDICLAAEIPLDEHEQMGGLFKSESGREEDFEHLTEIPEIDGFWISP